jgi:signal transduction histidine kinase
LPHTSDSAQSPARRDFLRRFFHDLATPLSAVSLHLDGADRRVRRGMDPTDALTVARTELGKAFDLFDRGRDFLLEDSGGAEAFDFDGLVGEAAGAHPGVRVEGRTGARVSGDRSALSGALSALIVNAVEAAGAGSVLVSVERNGGSVRARVENPGQLGTENPDTLFSPKAAGAGKIWGMGLCRASVAAGDAGGAVRIEQKESRVLATLELPEETR